MSRILSRDEVNEINIIISLLTHSDDISFRLRGEKIWDLFFILKMEIDMPEPEESQNPEDYAIEFELPEFVLRVDTAARYFQMEIVKELILKRLIELEAYLEVVELSLDKIRLKI